MELWSPPEEATMASILKGLISFLTLSYRSEVKVLFSPGLLLIIEFATALEAAVMAEGVWRVGWGLSTKTDVIFFRKVPGVSSSKEERVLPGVGVKEKLPPIPPPSEEERSIGKETEGKSNEEGVGVDPLEETEEEEKVLAKVGRFGKDDKEVEGVGVVPTQDPK